VDVLFIRLPDASEDEIDLSLAELPVLLRHGPYGGHVDGDTRVLPTQPTEHRRDKPGNNIFVACDPDFTDRRIGQELDALHALAQFIEYGRSTVEQCAAVRRRLDPLATAIKQAHAECMLQLGDRP
jgi:hypothetical protein